MKRELTIIWTTDSKTTTERMVFTYAHNSMKRGWWDRVTVVIWGASAKLAAEDEAVRTRIREMSADGVVFEACKACADQLGVSDALIALGVDVRYWGQSLTEVLQSGSPVITV